LAIYSAREEVGIMRLVGAENQYIRGPFVVQGILYGFVSAVLTLAILYPATLWLSQKTSGFFGGMDVYVYYANNFMQLFTIIVVLGVLFGVIASLFAIRKYLRK
jgi:cell division transport system permease protein